MSVFNGRFAQITTMGMGLFCCAEMTASGVESTPVGDEETGTPATLVTVNCGQLTARWNNYKLGPESELTEDISGEFIVVGVKSHET